MRKEGKLSIHLNGKLTNRHTKRELEYLLFAIEDYVGLKEQLNTNQRNELGNR